MRRCCVPLAVLLFWSTLTPAAEPEWLELTGPKAADVWKGKTDGWSLVDTVKLDADNPRRLLFDGTGPIWINGTKGNAPNLVTRQSFGDCELHLEFMLPKGSNSGVKFHGHYEIQLFDSFGKKELTGADCGGIYPRAETKPVYRHLDKGIAPKVNACKAPGEWQTLDVVFQAPRFDAAGKKTADARIVKATLNGEVIHEDQVLKTPTGHADVTKEVPTGPLLLQGDHGFVAFRNVKVRPLPAGEK
jgi:hypothetical protein